MIKISCYFRFSKAYFHTALQREVPGLSLIPNFVSKEIQEKLTQFSLNLHHAIYQQAKTGEPKKAVTYLSQQHNLKSEEHYKNIVLRENDKKINAQHFERYGEDGHELTYFIDNPNIPSFVRNLLIPPIENLEVVQDLKSNASLNWRFTFNTYRPSRSHPELLSGFDFHVDTPSNGDITMIYTLLSDGELEMRQLEKTSRVSSFILRPGSLLVLSNEARWKWEHRVVQKTIAETNSDRIYRMSLVLGCRRVEVSEKNSK